MTISELRFRILDFVGCVKLFSADTSPPLAKGGRNRSSIFHLPSSIFHPRSSTRHPGAGTDSKRIGPPGSPGLTARGAFTLVEMLVAVGLVVLMMTLFATIFQIATGAMSTQKGLAENDQRVRLVLTRLRNDLNGNAKDQNDLNRPYRTFRNLVPFGPDEQPPIAGFVDRNGYFYISENDPNDDTDDVLALTVFMPSGSPERFTGRAAVVFPDNSGPPPSYGPGNPIPGAGAYPPPAPATVTVANSPGNGQNYWPNQPEFDDIQGTPNLAGSSPYAEVCYFLRRGTLYRRVMLIRQPNLGPTQAPDGTPTDNTPTPLNMTSDYGAGGSRNFWTDFDYAAYFDSRLGFGLRFHGTGPTSVINIDSLSPVSTVPNPFTLGNPAFRFGFDSTTVGVAPSATYGQPREFISTGAAGTPPNSTFFIGRFTHSETSSQFFGYPGNQTGASGNPMNSATPLNYNTTTGAVSNYAGPRGGEDALMTNVLKFDIKVFDPAASVGPDGLPGVALFDDDNNTIVDDISELGWPGSDDGDFRDIGHLGTNGFYNFNPRNVPVTMRFAGLTPLSTSTTGLTSYVYPNTYYSNPLPAFNMNRYDTWNPKLDLDFDVPLHRSDCPPFRPFDFGADRHPGSATVVNPISGIAGDDDGNFVVDNANEIGWPGTDDNPIPLRAIQIKITFYDRTSKQVRETTLVQSLIYP